MAGGLYMSVMPMIKHKAVQSGLELNEVEKCLEEATVDIYVNEGNVLNSYQQTWKIDRRVWGKFCKYSLRSHCGRSVLRTFMKLTETVNPEVFPMPAPKKPSTKPADEHAVKAPEGSISRSDGHRSSKYRSRSPHHGRAEERGPSKYSGRFSQKSQPMPGPYGISIGDSYRPNYNKSRSREKSWRRSRSPGRVRGYEHKPREQGYKSESRVGGSDGASDVQREQPRRIGLPNEVYERPWSATGSSWYKFEDHAKASRYGVFTRDQHSGIGESKAKVGNEASAAELRNGKDGTRKPNFTSKAAKMGDGGVPGSPELVLSPSLSEK